MRKIIVQEFITLDGVMQAPGGPEEDPSNDFKFGGWTAPYFHDADDVAAEFMQKWMESTDILLGRKTYEIFAGYWPTHADIWPGINEVTKYVISTTMSEEDVKNSGWNNSVLIKDIEDVKKLKETDGPAIKVHGSGDLVQTLLKNDLVDELCLMTFPITLGSGKRLFEHGPIPAAFTMTDSLATPNGVFCAIYQRAGDVQTGSVAE